MNCLNFTVDEWLYYLENAHQQEIQLGLTRVSAVAARCGLLHWDAQIITVAGTNGKGSTVATLEAIYSSAGYRVATYTSPHLITFNERIRLNKQPITDENLCAAFLAIEHGRDSTVLTYFEMATLAALWYFKQCKPDVIILEVGMGGRLDATNILDADLAIITTIDLDHQDYLGDTKEAIGYEKAGILREKIPFIYADYLPPASVTLHAQLLNTQMYCLGEDYSFKTSDNSLKIIIAKEDDCIELPLPKINHKAATAAIMASRCLQSILPVTRAQLSQAMQTVWIIGRQQVVQGDTTTTIFDVSHNPQAVGLLADFIGCYKPKAKVHAVFSGLKDKDLCGLIKPMLPCVDFWYPAVLSSKRAASESQLLSAFRAERCIISVCFDDPLAAYQAAMHKTKPNDIVIVYGSFLTVSAIMAANRVEHEELR